MDINTTQPPVIDDHTVDHTDDIAAIRQIITDTQTAMNTNDAELLTASFAENATVGNAAGMVISGRDALLAANRRGLAGFLKDEYVRYDVTDIRFPRPDVALAYKQARATTPEGELIDIEPAMVALYVLVKEGGRWWTVARQNTPVPKG
ncbi:SgcJ/EcaC family oxidoreductase [Nocardia sp. AG03]|uniref:SgcJ/EcaC family oxidoreductase n=1 Tax=Nocardia sp. AG03 TaxID=3025312 RepID=UPI00241894BF|nr:SgcJ/EcaC family oxidoreductase [Nocardia sp. AG03]